MSQKTVRLKNGTEEGIGMVAVTMKQLESLLKEGMGGETAAYELVMLCRDKDHKPWGKTGDRLDGLNLITKLEDGTFMVPEPTRNIILSALIKGDGLDMSFGDPVA